MTRAGAFLPYVCRACGRPRQTTALDAPDICPTCAIDRARFQALKSGDKTGHPGLPAGPT